MPWARDRIPVFVHELVDGTVPFYSAIIMLSRAANNVATMFRRHSRFIDFIRIVLNYGQAFELEYVVPFIWRIEATSAEICRRHNSSVARATRHVCVTGPLPTFFQEPGRLRDGVSAMRQGL